MTAAVSAATRNRKSYTKIPACPGASRYIWAGYSCRAGRLRIREFRGAEAERGWQRVHRCTAAVLSQASTGLRKTAATMRHQNQRRRLADFGTFWAENFRSQNGAYLLFEQNDRSALTYPEASDYRRRADPVSLQLREQVCGHLSAGNDDLVWDQPQGISARGGTMPLRYARDGEKRCGLNWTALRGTDQLYVRWSLLEERGQSAALSRVGKWNGVSCDYQRRTGGAYG